MAPELYEMLLIQRETRDLHFPECPWVFSRAGKPIRGTFARPGERACKAASLTKTIGGQREA